MSTKPPSVPTQLLDRRWAGFRRRYAVPGLFSLTATAVVILAGVVAAHEGLPQWEALGLGLLILAVGEIPMATGQLRRTWEGPNLGEGALIVVLALVPAPWVVLLSLPAMAAHLAVRRDVRRRELRLTVMHSGLVITSGGLAVVAAAAVSGGWNLATTFPDARAFTAATIAAAVRGITIWVATAGRSGWAARAQTRSIQPEGPNPVAFGTASPGFPASGSARDRAAFGPLGLRLEAMVASTAFGLLVVAFAYWDPLVLLGVPIAVASLATASVFTLRSMEYRRQWREISAAARELADVDEPAIVCVARNRALTLFRADTAALVLLPPLGAAPVDDSPVHAHREPAQPAHGKDVRNDWIHDPAQTPGSRREREPGTRANPLIQHGAPQGRGRWLRRGVRTVSTSLRVREQRIGTLTLTFHRPVPWHEHEEQVLAAFAHTVSGALAHARLHAHARRQAAEQAHDAEHDWLTGLGNRRLLMARAVGELDRAGTRGGTVGLVMIDLDRFKIINDSLGHSAGDRVLRAVAERLRRGVRHDDVVARLGGDEFAVLLTGIDDPAQAETAAAQLAGVLCRDVVIDGMTLALEASVGVACYPQDGGNSEELLQRADIAMYQAKRAHPRWRRFDADSHDPSVERLALVAELRSAITGNELVLNYQPQVELRTGRISGVEALVRWNHPQRGMLTPETFIPAVEQSGLVQDFTRAILEQALAACASWRAGGFDVTVSVNLSARNLLNVELPGEVAKLLVKHQVPAKALTLEITETAMMADKDMARQLLTRLRQIGVRIAVDDFGTGFSSLTLLQERVLDEVKVDQSFVRKLLVERGDAAIVSATIHLAHTHNLRVVAEGVETPELMEALASLRCDLAQGLHIGAAMPLAELTSRLRGAIATPRLAVGANARILPLHRRHPPGHG